MIDVSRARMYVLLNRPTVEGRLPEGVDESTVSGTNPIVEVSRVNGQRRAISLESIVHDLVRYQEQNPSIDVEFWVMIRGNPPDAL